ncbi:MAG: hypothetical protein MHMPM18_004231, partial [Marteilia pararefringens]
LIVSLLYLAAEFVEDPRVLLPDPQTKMNLKIKTMLRYSSLILSSGDASFSIDNR